MPVCKWMRYINSEISAIFHSNPGRLATLLRNLKKKMREKFCDKK